MRAIIDEERVRHAVAAEGRGQLILHRAALFVSTGVDAQRVTRMIVDHGQRMHRAPLASPTWPLKSICHNKFGASFSKRRQALGPPGGG